MVKFLIVRHGHSVANEQSIFAGITDVALSKIGEQQAEAVSNYILNNHQIDAIYSSQLSRAKNTIKKVSESLNIPIITNPAFNEVYGGKWEGLKFEEIYNLYTEDFVTWLNDILNSRCTDGESFKQVCQRTSQELKRLAEGNEGKTILIATHAGALRSIVTSLKNLNNEECAKLGWVSNASTTTVIYQDGNFQIQKMGFDEYLNDLKTALPKNV